jgi:hypothetical protein
MFEALLEPGEPVAEGEPVGRLWFVDRPDRPPSRSSRRWTPSSS